MKDYIKKKNEFKAKQLAEEEEEKRKIMEELRIKAEANEVPKNPQKEHRKFIDEMFGKDFDVASKMLVDQTLK